MKKRILAFFLCLVFGFALAATVAYACNSCYSDSTWYPAACVCTGDGVNIRPHHNTTGSIGGAAYKGDLGTTAYLYGSIYNKPNSWYWVAFYSGNAAGINGWVNAQYIATDAD